METDAEDFINVSNLREDGINRGLTKREYFAAMMIQGILANANGIQDVNRWVNWSVEYADALIEELNKAKGEL